MKVLSRSEVCKRLGFSRTTLWRLESDPGFPRKRQLTARRVGWIEEEINSWLEAR